MLLSGRSRIFLIREYLPGINMVLLPGIPEQIPASSFGLKTCKQIVMETISDWMISPFRNFVLQHQQLLFLIHSRLRPIVQIQFAWEHQPHLQEFLPEEERGHGIGISEMEERVIPDR